MKRFSVRNLTRLGLIILFAAGFDTSALRAQIQFQKAFAYSGEMTYLEKDGPKFYLMDVPANQCRIYNPDWTLWKTIQLQVPSGKYLYDIQYVTQNLFNSDDGVELLYVFYQYVETTDSYYYIYTTRIADESGSILLDLPGCSWTSIRNIEGDGSRMLNYIMDYSVYPYTVETRIYRLPGSLTGVEEANLSNEDDSRLAPNPTDGPVHLESSDLRVAGRAEWVVMTLSGELVARVPVADSGESVDLKGLGLSSGTYLVRLESKNYQTKFHKVVLSN
jgi:hypothetical protein